MPKFLGSGALRLASLLLLLQAALLYSSIRPEAVRGGQPLAGFPRAVETWRLYREGVVEPEVQEVLRADDLLNREYLSGIEPIPVPVNLFIAAFRSQRDGKAPHSPKNCLPGSGWTQLDAGYIPIEVNDPAGGRKTIVVNRYEVQHEEQRSLVLYWYQSRDRVVANEFRAKFWVVADAIRLNRTDTALIRVIVPILNRDSAMAERTAVSFAQSFYPPIREFLPN